MSNGNAAYRRSRITGNTIDEAVFGYIDESTPANREVTPNAMSVDVEEHFQVSAFNKAISREDWESANSRVVRNVNRILQVFDSESVRATFFTLGWVAEREPQLIKLIADEGHEIASHGYDHALIGTMSPEKFLEDVTRTKAILEDVSGVSVIGYRAPSFSINRKSLWAHDKLLEAGYRYSSSIYPIVHDHYGIPSAPRFPFRLKQNGLLELPLTTTTAFGRNWPCAGGGYFRLLPTTYSRWAIKRVNNVDRMPAAFYFHPWEIDPDQPRVVGAPFTARFRHYVNLSRFETRLIGLLREFQWGRMDDIYSDALARG